MQWAEVALTVQLHTSVDVSTRFPKAEASVNAKHQGCATEITLF